MAKSVKSYVLLAVAAVLFSLRPSAAAPSLNVGPSFGGEELTPYMEVLTDPGGNLSVLDVSSSRYSSRFFKATEKNTNFGYINAAVWVRYSLRNDLPIPKELYVKFSQPWVDCVELYLPSATGYKIEVSGDTVPFSQRLVADRNIMFPLNLPSGVHTFFMRFKTTSTLSLPLVVISPETYEATKRNELPLLWILYGVLSGMVVYNLFLFVLIRDRNYLYYILFIASILLYIMTRHGTSFMYLWPDNVWWANTSLSFFLVSCCIWFTQFARSFLNTSRILRNMDYILRCIVLVAVVEMVIVMISSGEFIDKMAVYTSMISMIIVTVAALLVLKKGERSARVYFIAWLIFLVAAGIDYLRGMGFLPDNGFTRYSMNLGTSLQVIIFSFGIAERITSLQRERISALEALTASEEKYRTLVENATEAIFVTQDFMIKFENTNALKASGFSPEEVHSREFLDFIHPDDREVMLDRHMKRLNGEEVSDNFHFRIVSKSGDVRWMEISAVPISWEGRPAILNFMNDITERKTAEEKIRASLREKEVLLKEIHHRVKNNMQIVSSLLNLQIDFIRNDEDRRIFLDSQNRIHSMALIHEKMYQSQDLVNIDFGEYLENLLHSLMQSYHVSTGMIDVKVKVDRIFISIDTAIPCALIINEIVSNSLKHAFPAGTRGEINISMVRKDDEMKGSYELIVGDNGAGMNPAVDYENPRTLGIQLIRTLVRQLKGQVNISPVNGTAYTIMFPAVR